MFWQPPSPFHPNLPCESPTALFRTLRLALDRPFSCSSARANHTLTFHVLIQPLSQRPPLMTRPALYNNLVLKKPWLLETSPPPPLPPPPPTTTTLLFCFFLSRAERIRPGDTAEPFDSDWTSKCLHFHLLIHCLVASLWPHFCFPFSFVWTLI